MSQFHNQIPCNLLISQEGVYRLGLLIRSSLTLFAFVLVYRLTHEFEIVVFAQAP